jgi:hypothetical protein
LRKPSYVDPRFGQTHLKREGKDCTVEIWPRPNYCDRGSVEVHVLVRPERRADVVVDAADSFPRYYFDLDCAKSEVQDWMEARKQVLDAPGKDDPIWTVVEEDAAHRAAAAHLVSRLSSR